jgi:hypothetical protein
MKLPNGVIKPNIIKNTIILVFDNLVLKRKEAMMIAIGTL